MTFIGSHRFSSILVHFFIVFLLMLISASRCVALATASRLESLVALVGGLCCAPLAGLQRSLRTSDLEAMAFPPLFHEAIADQILKRRRVFLRWAVNTWIVGYLHGVRVDLCVAIHLTCLCQTVQSLLRFARSMLLFVLYVPLQLAFGAVQLASWHSGWWALGCCSSGSVCPSSPSRAWSWRASRW